MTIAFVNPPIQPYRKIMRNFDCATESKGNYLYQPYDFLLMSARVPLDWDLILIDAIADHLSPDEVIGTLRNKTPHIIVMAMADTNWSQDLNFLNLLRSEFPKSKLLACGDSFFESHACTKVAQACDGIIDNPIDIDFKALVQGNGLIGGLKQDPYLNNVSKKPIQIQLGMPRHSIFMNSLYRLPFARHFAYTTIFSAWGCPYSCSYCIMSAFPNLWRAAEEVLREMEHIRSLGIQEIYMGDRSFGLPRKNVISLLEGMIQRKFNFSWSTYFRPNQYDPELLELMALSGCHTLIIGIETANDSNLKNFQRVIPSGTYQKLITHARKLKMDICGDFIIGLPGDSISDVENTILLAKKLDIQYASFNVATPLPGTSLRSSAILEGKMSKDEHHYDSLGKNKILASDQLSGEQILHLRNKAVRSFYTRPSFLAKRLFAIHSQQQLLIQLQEAYHLLTKTAK